MTAKPSTIVGLVLLALSLAGVLITPLTPGFDPFTQRLDQGLIAPFTDVAHILGTDPLGRDLLSRLALAGRTSMLIALGSLAVSVIIGVTAGLVAGYFGRLPEAIIMGVADLQLSIPILLLLVMVVALVGPSIPTLIVVLGLTTWVGYARVARVGALALREREFVLAARAMGASSAWIIRRHLLPQLVPQLAILASFNLGVLVILESGLSYLGLGAPPPTPTWGAMINEGQDFLQVAPYLCILPGMAICLLVAGVQILSQRFTSEGAVTPGGGA